MTKDLIERAKQAMTDARLQYKWGNSLKGEGNTGGDNVITGCIRGTNSIVRTYPCHRPINGFQNAEALWSAFGHRCSKEVGKFYFDWLISRSPWSDTGIVPNLDKDFMLDQGFIWTDLDKISANLLHNFLVASRAAAEWPSYITDWYSLIHDYNIHEDLAFFMMTVFTDIDGVGQAKSFLSKTQIVFSMMDKYDWPLDTFRCDEEYLLNFLSHKTPGKSKKMFFPTAVTAPVNILWGSVNTKKTYINNISERYKSLLELKTIRGTYNIDTVWGMTKDNALSIIREEEIRLGLKKEKVAA